MTEKLHILIWVIETQVYVHQNSMNCSLNSVCIYVHLCTSIKPEHNLSQDLDKDIAHLKASLDLKILYILLVNLTSYFG